MMPDSVIYRVLPRPLDIEGATQRALDLLAERAAFPWRDLLGGAPTVADVLSYLKGLRRKNLVGAAFASYGWAGESAKLVQDALTEMGVATVEPLKCQYVPDTAALEAARSLGQKVAARLKEALR